MTIPYDVSWVWPNQRRHRVTVFSREAAHRLALKRLCAACIDIKVEGGGHPPLTVCERTKALIPYTAPVSYEEGA